MALHSLYKKHFLVVLLIISWLSSFSQIFKPYYQDLSGYPKIRLAGILELKDNAISPQMIIDSAFLRIWDYGQPCEIFSIDSMDLVEQIIMRLLIDKMNKYVNPAIFFQTHDNPAFLSYLVDPLYEHFDQAHLIIINRSADSTVSDTVRFTGEILKRKQEFLRTIVDSAAVLYEADDLLRSIFILCKGNHVIDTTAFTDIIFDRMNNARDSIVYWKTDLKKLFEILECECDYDPVTDSNYSGYKQGYLLNYLHDPDTMFIDSMLVSQEQELEALKMYLLLDPKDTSQLIRRYLLEASMYESGDKFETAASYYNKCVDISAGEQREDMDRKFRANFFKALDQYYNNNEFTKFNQLAAKHLDEIENSFKYRYSLATSLYNVHDYTNSVANYDWLISNWTDNQNHITWELANIRLAELYSYTNRFDKSLPIYQKFFRETSNETYLWAYLKTLKLKYLTPVSLSLPVFYNTFIKEKERTTRLRELIQVPACVKGVYYYNDEAGYISVINSEVPQNRISDARLKAINKFPFIYEEGKDVFIINMTGSKCYSIVQYSQEYKDAEVFLVNDVRNKKLMAEPWKSLNDHESSQLLKFYTEIFSYMLSVEIVNREDCNLSEYWDNQSKASYITYMVIHNTEGGIAKSIKFEKNSAVYETNMWQKSSTTTGFFMQRISYKGKDTIDLTSPVFREHQRKGVIRIGMEI